MNDVHKKALGKKGEEYVCSYLETRGYTILELNFSTRYGEIDLIAQHENLIAFVEVKTRKKEYFPIAQVITPSKQKKIIATAKHYIATKTSQKDLLFRFDVALLVTNNATYEIEYIEHAFWEENS